MNRVDALGPCPMLRYVGPAGAGSGLLSRQDNHWRLPFINQFVDHEFPEQVVGKKA